MSRLTSQVAHDHPDDAAVAPRQRRGRDVRPARMNLNFTSMIDVVFLLMIYFIITVNFAVGEGVLTAKLPQGTGEADAVDPPTRPLKLVIIDSGPTGCHIAIEGLPEAPKSFTELATLLDRIQYDPKNGRRGAYKPDNPVIIQPTTNVRWQHVVNTFNAAVKARYSNISFAQALSEHAS